VESAKSALLCPTTASLHFPRFGVRFWLTANARRAAFAGVLITVTEVRLGPDLKHATAFVTRLGRSDIGDKLPALRRAAPFLRAQLARALRLRYAPDVHFQADTSIDNAMHIDALLHAPEVARDIGPEQS